MTSSRPFILVPFFSKRASAYRCALSFLLSILRVGAFSCCTYLISLRSWLRAWWKFLAGLNLRQYFSPLCSRSSCSGPKWAGSLVTNMSCQRLPQFPTFDFSLLHTFYESTGNDSYRMCQPRAMFCIKLLLSCCVVYLYNQINVAEHNFTHRWLVFGTPRKASVYP